MKKIYFVMTLVIMTMVSCVPEAEKASVETVEVREVTSNSAEVVCKVTEDGGAEITSRGVCWGVEENPVIETASSMGGGSGIGNYECEIKGLNSNATYYVRAYATNSAGISYGEVISFKTSFGGGNDNGGDDDSGDNNFDTDGEISGHGYVDLGLPSGVKWATCNVGAETPTGFGDYFAWGETSPKAEYSWETYQHWVDANGDGECGEGETTIDSDISGNAQYDAATANWGGSWRMPTVEELEELYNNCEWLYMTINGLHVMKVTGPNGHSIYLPVAGCRRGSSLDYAGGRGYFWSSAPDDFSDDYAYSLYFDSDGSDVSHYGGRYYGQTVRAVSE